MTGPILRAVKLSWEAFSGWPLGDDEPGATRPSATLAQADLALLPVFEDERPLQGVGAWLDWRSSGGVTRWIDAGLFAGRSGERLLSIGRPELGFARVLLLGLGRRADFDATAGLEAVGEWVRQARGLRAQTIVISWPRVEGAEVHDAALEALIEAATSFAFGALRAGDGSPVTEGESSSSMPDGAEPLQAPASPGEASTRARAREADAETQGVHPAAADAAEGPDPSTPAETDAPAAAAQAESPVPPTCPPTWWLVAEEPLYTRFRGRLLGTPRVAVR